MNQQAVDSVITGPAIELRNVRRVFRRTTGRGLRRSTTETEAVRGINLHVERGEIIGWLGPNGAGKSTTIKMCTGILVPTSGETRVLGLDPTRQRRQMTRNIGVVFGQRSQLWWDLPLLDSFTLLHKIHRIERHDAQRRIDELSDLFDVHDQLDIPVRQLSLGQRMRGELIAALLHQPQVLFLDEPTIGLDVVSKHAMREALLALRNDHGVTIVLTTHDLGDVRRLCDRVVVIDRGQVALDTSLAGLLARAGSQRTLIATFESETDARRVGGTPLAGLTTSSIESNRVAFDVDLNKQSIPHALNALGALAVICDLTVVERDIEQIVRDLYAAQTATSDSPPA